ncbi:MAG TPA: glycogen synthase [Egibacteraceae bacterium]|nr:glycogen synthase [Egibacteraceae bacterium]
MRVALLSKEYPPEVYGGAGVHVAGLSAELAKLVDVAVHAFGAPRDDALVAATYQPWDALAGDAPGLGALRPISVDLAMAAAVGDADVVHSHTWYANLGGHLAKLLHGVPHVMTSHSLEPQRPWKAEQLAGGYAVSSWCERVSIEAADAVVAVSAGMRDDILACYPAVDADRVHVIHNGIDPSLWRPEAAPNVLALRGIDPERPTVAFVGRITRQKGVPDLLRAAASFDPAAQLVVLAGRPDTPEIGREVRELVAGLQAERTGVVWIEDMLPLEQVRPILSHATVFVCPSVYEPFGLVNLEAMACGTAVVATRVGGIPEIVVEEETGLLVAPADASGMAAAVNRLVGDPDLAARMGAAGRARVEQHFTWASVAQRTADLYRSLT